MDAPPPHTHTLQPFLLLSFTLTPAVHSVLCISTATGMPLALGSLMQSHLQYKCTERERDNRESLRRYRRGTGGWRLAGVITSEDNYPETGRRSQAH